MAGIFEAIRFSDPIHGPSDTTDFLADVRNSVVNVEIDVRFETYVLAQSAVLGSSGSIEIAPNPANTGLVADVRTIWANKSNAFEGFQVGDRIFVVGAPTPANNGFATITEIVREDIIKTDKNFSNETLIVGGTVAVANVIDSFRHRFGLIENNESVNYVSKTDDSEQKSIIDGKVFNDLSLSDFEQLGKKSWQFGSIQIKGNDRGLGTISALSQGFTIVQELLISPLTLFNEFPDVQAGIQPDRFLNGQSLRYVFSMLGSTQKNDPNEGQLVEQGSLKGAVGGYNQKINGGSTNYSITNLAFKKADNTPNSALQLTTAETTINFSIENTTDAPFSDGDTKFIFGFNFSPSDEAQYRDNALASSNTLEYNFIYDNVLSTLGAASGTPRQDGTDLQAIKSLEVIFVSASKVDVTVIMELSSEVVSRIGANTTQQYEIYIQTANHNLTRANTDTVQLLIDANEFFVDASDPGLLLFDNKFLIHPDSDLDADGNEFLDSRIEDDVLAFSDIDFDRNGREEDEIVFTSIEGSIIARKNTGASFILDSRSDSLAALENITDPTYGDIPEVNLNLPRGFKTPADENRGNIKLFRQYTLDAGGVFKYRYQFPFIVRWEDFVPLTGVNDEFFDPTEPEDGRNQDWIKYDAATNWNLYYRITFNVTKNGDPISYFQDSVFNTFDYLTGTEWDSEVITTLDENGNILADGGTKFIIKYADGTVRADFNYIGASTPSLSNLTIVMKIDVYQEGTYKSTYWLSSDYDAHPATWWKSIDSSNRVVITNPSGSLFRGEAKLIGAVLPEKSQFKISARIYDDRSPVPPTSGGKQMEDGTLKTVDGGLDYKIIE